MTRLKEIHLCRRQRHGPPVQPAFQQQGPPGIRRAGIHAFQLSLQRVELVRRHPPMPAIDQRARRLGRIVDQGLGPVGARIVQVQRPPCGAKRRKPHRVANRVEQFQVQHGAPAGLGIAPDQSLAMTLTHGPSLDPSARIRNRPHGGRGQRIKRRHSRPVRRLQSHPFQERIPGQLELGIGRLEQFGRNAVRLGPSQQAARALMRRDQRHRSRRLRHHADRPIGNGIGQISVPRQGRAVPAAPTGLTHLG